MITLNNRKPKILIDPGHGGHDPGAVGPTGLQEADVVLKISKELMYQLDLLGIDSELSRTDDSALGLSERVHKSEGCDLMISIHANAATPQAEGIETVFAKGGPSKALANYIQQSMIKHFKGHKDRGLKMSPSMDYPRSLFVLTNAKVPTCLVEVEFISNPLKEQWLRSEETIGQIANALAQGIKSFILSLPGSGGGELVIESESVAASPHSGYIPEMPVAQNISAEAEVEEPKVKAGPAPKNKRKSKS